MSRILYGKGGEVSSIVSRILCRQAGAIASLFHLPLATPSTASVAPSHPDTPRARSEGPALASPPALTCDHQPSPALLPATPAWLPTPAPAIAGGGGECDGGAGVEDTSRPCAGAVRDDDPCPLPAMRDDDMALQARAVAGEEDRPGPVWACDCGDERGAEQGAKPVQEQQGAD